MFGSDCVEVGIPEKKHRCLQRRHQKTLVPDQRSLLLMAEVKLRFEIVP